ncbi:universal stress protein [Corynebacterium phocae]|uniref:Universal stress protein n=1 Tax=Corynebacterium phocae TaxID=161895 RepID=A0A1L7D5Q5_9CORY|nr:universal stress protein [Corynebacterium phocae]APT93474.1 universal stress protein [Corynebacterium phocae]KAA8721034.1 universal stress protein [Corynebacterium phocae]
MSDKELLGLENRTDPSQPLRVLAVWDPRNADSESLRVAAWLSHSTRVKVRVVTTFSQPWGSKQGKKYRAWLRAESQAVETAVRDALETEGIEKSALAKKFSVFVAGSSRAQLLSDAAAKFNADILLLPSSQSAAKNRILAGSTADALLHYSPVTLGLTPRAVKLSKHGISRVNFAYTDETGNADDPALRAAAAFASRLGVALRILAFSPAGLAQTPLNANLDVAKKLTSDWRERSLGLLDVARDITGEAHPELDISAEVGSGSGWRGAVDSLKWKKGDLMVLGSHPMGAFARVFIGSTATELLPHMRVPVLVHPVAR